jgi:hypothetical protein
MCHLVHPNEELATSNLQRQMSSQGIALKGGPSSTCANYISHWCLPSLPTIMRK